MGKKKKSPSGNFLLELVKKNLPWALGPLAAAVLFLIFVPGHSGPQSTIPQRFAFIFVVLGGFLSCLGALFAGPWGLAGGYGFVTILALSQMLPDPWNRYFSVLYLALLFGGGPLYRAIKQKKAPRQPEPPEDWEEPEDPVLPGCIFVLHNLTGRVYQLVRWGGSLRAYRVGGELKGLYEGKLVDLRKPRPLCKEDLEFPISQLQLKVVPHGVYGITARVRREKKRWSCNPYLSTTPEELEAFLKACIPQAQMPKAAPREDKSPQTRSRREQLTRIRTGFYIATGLVYLPWLFLDVPYKLFSVLSLLLFAAVLIFIARNLEHMTMEDNTRARGSKLEVVTLLTFPSILPMLRSLTDFDFLQWQPVLIGTVMAAALLFLLFYLLLRGIMEKILHVLVVILLCLAFGYSALVQVNYLTDFSPPEAAASQVLDLRVSTSSKGVDSYYVTVVLPDGTEQDIRTSKAHYQTLQVGDTVTIYTHRGGLGLAYAEVR